VCSSDLSREKEAHPAGLGRVRVCRALPSPARSPSPPFRGEREGPAKWEGEVGGATDRFAGLPHPASPPGRRGERIGKRCLREISLASFRKDSLEFSPDGPARCGKGADRLSRSA